MNKREQLLSFLSNEHLLVQGGDVINSFMAGRSRRVAQPRKLSGLAALFTFMRRSNLGKAKLKSYPFIVKNFGP
jgi:3-deoxy-D-arabino-heptulosonate 7-phosphate (DAHP) synthase class II